MVLFVVIYFVVKKCWNFLFMKDVFRLEWIYVGIYIKEKSEVRYMIIMFVNILGQGKINGNLEYLLIWYYKEVFVLLFVSGGVLK